MAKVRWGQIKRKNGLGGSAPGKGPGKVTPTKRKADAGDDADDEMPTSSTPKPNRGGRKSKKAKDEEQAATKADEDGDEEVFGARGKTVKKEEVDDD